MPFNGIGIFTTLGYPNYPAQAGTTIKASMFNANITDLVNGFTNCITRDGQSPPTANLPMGGKKHTGVAAAVSNDEYARYDQILNPSLGGTISVNTATPALKVTQAGSGYALLVEDQTSDPSPFCIDAAGLVGVGTLTPRAPLSIGAYLDLWSGAAASPTVANLRADAAGNLYLNAFNAGSYVRLGFESGNGGLDVKYDGYAAFTMTSAVKLPAGTTAQRPASPAVGDTRVNTTLTRTEWWNGAGWAAMGGGAVGGGSDDAFYENTKTITTSYSITSGKNAMAAGPITINDGVTVTVPDGSTLTVV